MKFATGDHVKVHAHHFEQLAAKYPTRFRDAEEIHTVNHVNAQGNLVFLTDRPGFALMIERFYKVVPKAVDASVQADINRAIGLSPEAQARQAAYLKAKQQAWDAYAESRRRMAQPLSEHYRSHFEAGWNALRDHQRAQWELNKARPLSRTGEAAPAITAAQAGKLKDLVLQALGSGPKTTRQIAAVIGRDLQSVTPRLAPLRRQGIIHITSGVKGQAVYALGNGIMA